MLLVSNILLMSKHAGLAPYAPLAPAVERPHASDDLEAMADAYDAARRVAVVVAAACQAAFQVEMEADLLADTLRGERVLAARRAQASHRATMALLGEAVILLDAADDVGAGDTEPLWSKVKVAIGEAERAWDLVEMAQRA